MRSNEEIVAAFQNGDNGALAELWENNQKGVRYIADRIAAAGLGEAEDLSQEGFFGLRRAAELYKPDQGGEFMAYAWHWIRQAMYSSIQKTGYPVRLPAWVHERIMRYKKFVREYSAAHGEDPTDDQIGAVLKISRSGLDTL